MNKIVNAKIAIKKPAEIRGMGPDLLPGEWNFEAGVDPKLKRWARLRQQLKDAREAGLEHETIPSNYIYRCRAYWTERNWHLLYNPPKELIDEHDDNTNNENISNTNDNIINNNNNNDSSNNNEENNTINDDIINDNNDDNNDNNGTNNSTSNDKDYIENTGWKKGTLNMHLRTTLTDFENMLWSNKYSNREIIIIAMNHSNNRLLELAIYAKSINVNTTIDIRNNTPLHLAAMYGDRIKIDFLLQAGANIRAINNRGITPLHLAIQVIPPRNEAPFFEPYLPINIVKLLVSKGADVNYQDDRGTTPLHRAALLGDLKIIDFLLKKKAKVYVLDKKNQMPIELAGKLYSEVKAIFDANDEYRGRREHSRMWARIISRQFVRQVIDISEPSCITCRRKQKDCDLLKRNEYRYWLFVHGRRGNAIL